MSISLPEFIKNRFESFINLGRVSGGLSLAVRLRSLKNKRNNRLPGRGATT
jgi:hypothetical protein